MPLKPEVILATCSDPRFSAPNTLDGNPKTFFLTTGLFPQEIIYAFKGNATANVSRINFTAASAKKVRIEKSCETNPSKFEMMAECDLDAANSGGKQIEQFNINKDTLGKGVRFVKLILVAGHEHFAAVFDFSIEGEEAETETAE